MALFYYSIELRIHAIKTERDYHAPAEWRGSGCCDEDFPYEYEVTLYVAAESMEAARAIAEDFNPDYCGELSCPYDDVKYDDKSEILSIVCDGPSDELSAGIYDAEYEPQYDEVDR